MYLRPFGPAVGVISGGWSGGGGEGTKAVAVEREGEMPSPACAYVAMCMGVCMRIYAYGEGARVGGIEGGGKPRRIAESHSDKKCQGSSSDCGLGQ